MDGIQLTSAAIQTQPGEQYQARKGVTLGEKPTDSPSASPEELKDEALPREQVEQFLHEIQRQPAWRRESDKCVDYYDGNQLSQDLVETLQSRGQPPLTSNLIKPTIDTVLGMEAKTRTDWRVRPEDDEECSDDLAEALSVKLKHAETESRADRAVSDAYAAQCKAGLGWVEVSVELDPFKSPYRVRYIHRREIFWDWRSEQPDLSDAKYLIRRRWLELDHAVSMLPQYAGLFRNTVGCWNGFDPMTEQDTGLVQSYEIERDSRMSTTDWRDSERKMICLYEIWYRKWVSGFVLRLANGTVIEADFDNPRHNEAILSGVVKVERATFQKVRLAWYAGPHFLYDVPSPYKHGLFPYVPFFGYREDSTGFPYGLVRSMISPQDEVNARKSKMLWILNSRRVIADANAVVDHDKTAREVARPDAYIILDPKRSPNSRFEISQGGDLAAQQFSAMQEAKQEIAEASGIHKTMMGQQSGATSGLAINSLVEQGLNTLAEINDNYRFSRRLVGEMLFDLVRQSIMGRPAKVTIGEGEDKKVILLNQPSTDESGQSITYNDIAKVKAKVVLDDIPSSPTYRMQQLSMLTEITKSLPPQLQASIVDFVVKSTDFPDRHKMAERLRNAAGIQDPQAMAQAQQAQQAQAQQAQQAQMQMQQAAQAQQDKLATLGAAETAAEIRKLNAEADLALAKARQIGSAPAPASLPQQDA